MARGGVGWGEREQKRKGGREQIEVVCGEWTCSAVDNNDRRHSLNVCKGVKVKEVADTRYSRSRFELLATALDVRRDGTKSMGVFCEMGKWRATDMGENTMNDRR